METYNIVIVGVGGQGTLLTSRILGNLALTKDYDVKLSEVHGMAQRGGSVITFVRFGDSVAEPIIEAGQADLLIAFERLEAVRYIHLLKPDGLLIMNDERIDPMPVVIGAAEYPEDKIAALDDSARVVRIAARREARELGNLRIFNTIVLGAASLIMPFAVEEWEQVIRETVPAKTVDINLVAFAKGRTFRKDQ